ncbi:inorganic phosphate transporter [Aestuariispira insulae]|uniref:Phosphate transporter n=1 Tax=Aestuariispira insulae TaxID=1461337 RepID=A0A3D9HS78_9PROT|nr:inorganic phosphate transporter [Aestuariispira insulae]RED52358.1 PiT family inorganic phosphate transporter [Aestuariispira insulae]
MSDSENIAANGQDNLNPRDLKKESLDKDLNKIVQVQAVASSLQRRLLAPGLGLMFLTLAGAFASLQAGAQPNAVFIMVAAILGGYMALNIGANDVANNVGPAVGSKALTMTGALIIAAIFESAGALLAGGDVVSTISKGIIDPSLVQDDMVFVWAMMAALLSSALWVNLATFIGAPVSTTHSVVGGVMGAGIAAVGFQTVNWETMSKIAASWVISPLLGGIIAALFLAFIKTYIIYRDDKIAAAKRWVPILIAVMAGAFSCYLAMKGLKKIIHVDSLTIISIGATVFVVSWLVLHPVIARQAHGLENRNQSLRQLFHIPLICSAALLSFAHGANDVANAIGPLAAILHALQSGEIAAKVAIPSWVMLIGALGISLGLFLYGPRLIRMVGEQITKMNPMRAYCVALSAAITVIVASALGLPVSSTHIAVGGVFGVGFFREYYTRNSKRRQRYVRKYPSQPDKPASENDIRRRKLVRRAHFTTIVAAWVITVPAAALLSAVLYYAMAYSLG